MNFDEMLETWRTQDTAPIYRMNPDLLRVVVRQDYAEIRRGLFWDLWAAAWVPWVVAGVMLVLMVAVLFAATSLGAFTPAALDFLVTVIAVGVIVVSACEFRASHRRQAEIERGFGSSLQEDIRRNLSRIDDAISRYGRLTSSLLIAAPVWATAILVCWVIIRLNEGWSGWIQALMFTWPFILPVTWTTHYFKQRLQEHRRRLSQLLDLLNAGE